ncbi:CapA family protein [Alkalibacillus haloalkaliphilus]|uniref:CapA family protein n=1 Tax=Alkalibacillus haloalkaliphilus TaxID=94136 RepID=UPI00293657AA|nr:CapA family protein [Alkalibacillus haloalkaliphilus]MDV2583320.1 CapA family protein [Alkalibacillus haloalkaliphilus]
MKHWLDHINSDYIPKMARGDKLSMFVIALEGWRRGLGLEFYETKRKSKKEVTYSLSSERKTVPFAVSKGDEVSGEAVKLAGNKWLTKRELEKKGVDVPKGIVVGNDISLETLEATAKKVGYPLVIKPTDSNLGKGVLTNISNFEQLKSNFDNLKNHFKNFIIEEHIDGDEVRVYVVNNEIIAATKRIPANVIGDGKNSIKQLIQDKNKERDKNPNYGNRQIKVDQELKATLKGQGLSVNSVPKKSERVFLRKKSNISSGGEPVDLTSVLPEKVKKAAYQATENIPGLVQAGIDILYDDKSDRCGIIEINTRPGIGMHMFPEKGSAKDIPKAIIDYYFPETKDKSISDRKSIYYDFDTIMSTITEGQISKVSVPNLIDVEYSLNEVIVYGKGFNNLNLNWIKRKLNFYNIDSEISGYDEQIKLLTHCSIETLEEFLQEFKSKSPFSKKIQDIKTQEAGGNLFKGVKLIKKISSTKLNSSQEDIQRDSKQNSKTVLTKKKRLNRNLHKKLIKKFRGKKVGAKVINKIKKLSDNNYPKKVTIAATGDVLLHKRLYKTAKKGNGYNFDDKLKEVEHLFNDGDLKIVNQESIIAGKEIGLSSFPNFNSPVDFGYKLKDLGVDIVSIANNHVLDKGKEGLFKSIENWNEIGIPYVGAYNSKKDSEELRILEANGLRVCFLSYTRSLNGKNLDDNDAHLVGTYKPFKMKPIKDLLKKIKNEDLADITVVSMHFGKEYHLMPSAEQKEVAADLSDAGADVILGHHPHVIQPPEWIYNSRGKRCFVAYSLGNFYTGQVELHRQIGAYLTIDVEKTTKESKVLNLVKPKLVLTFVDACDKKDFKMYTLKEYVKRNRYIKTESGQFNSQEVYDEVRERLKQNIKDLEIE